MESWEHIVVLDPFARQYFKLGYRLYPYLQGDVKLGWASDRTRSGERDNSFAWGIGLRPDMHFMLTQSVGIDFTLGQFGYRNFGKNMSQTRFGFELEKVEIRILFFF